MTSTVIQPLQREIYEKPTLIRLPDSRLEQKSLVMYHVHSTKLARMCLAYQHFDFNSANWFSDNLHVISS